jgi:uncharacterized repeat protein (TIGR01451 family)
VPPAAAAPVPPPAPLLYVRFVAAPGLAVTFFPGGPHGRTFPAPVTVGLRPGYVYRVMLSGFRDYPGLLLFPTLEVRGTLQRPKTVRPADHPAPLAFGPDDLARIQGGGLLTKVVYLENPEQAIPEPSRPDQPLEIDVAPATDPLEEARLRGRPVLIVRLGEREVSAEELARHAVPGTMLLPGDKRLPPPAAKPWVPFACVPLFDPILGPKPPTEECLHDGGDVGAPAGISPDGLAHGIDPSDTVAEYSDSRGGRHLAISNRLCLCVPRFVAIRNVIGLGGYAALEVPGGATGLVGQAALAARQPSDQTHQNEQLEAVRGRERATRTIGRQILGGAVQVEVLNAVRMEIGTGAALGTSGLALLKTEEKVRLTRQIEFAHQFGLLQTTSHVEQVNPGPEVVGRVEGLSEVVRVQETREFAGGCHLETPPPPDRPLTLYKWANRQSGQVGDVVTFYLKFTNHGGRPITDVAVTDSLTGRLEYVPGTARADRDAVFTKQENQAGSLILRWEIRGRLLPGQSGVVSFQARIR